MLAASLSLMVALPSAARAQLPDPPPQAGPNPALPWAAPSQTDCDAGSLTCVDGVIKQQKQLTLDLGCNHKAVFAATYWQLTTFMRQVDGTAGFFVRPDRVAHEDVEYNKEYQRQIAAWRAGDVSQVTPDWQAVFAANDAESMTGSGDLLASIAAHVLGDMPTKALEQSDGVMRLKKDTFPFGKTDHDKVNYVLRDATLPIIQFIADHYDPRVDDNSSLAGVIANLLYEWREQSWRNAEDLRFISVATGRDSLTYQIEAQQIRDQALAEIKTIIAGNQDDAAGREARNKYCALNKPTS
jgi:hypothetical protein